MKFRHKNHSPHLVYELLLAETDAKGLAVYSQPRSRDGIENFFYVMFRPVDMIAVKESHNKQRV